jgi:cytoskeletal protein CcmA (bactofilin family)
MTNIAEAELGALSFDLREHNVVFVLPANSSIAGHIVVPGGALIQGKLVGSISCTGGSLIFAPNSIFAGNAEADKIYIGGSVATPKNGESTLTARTLMAISGDGVVHANIAARLFAVNSKNVFGVIKTLPPARD